MFARAFSSSPLSRKCFASSQYARAMERKSSATFRRWDFAGGAILILARALSVRDMSFFTSPRRSTPWELSVHWKVFPANGGYLGPPLMLNRREIEQDRRESGCT